MSPSSQSQADTVDKIDRDTAARNWYCESYDMKPYEVEGWEEPIEGFKAGWDAHKQHLENMYRRSLGLGEA